MTEVSPPRDREGFEIAIICALRSEADAVEASFDRFWDDDGDTYGKAPGDTNSYTTGVIGRRNVVLAFMPGMGKGSAASVAASIRSSFGGIKLALVVGFCAGVPKDMNDEHHILLGDVVISKGVIQYDFGRQIDGGFRRKTDVEESLGRPNLEFRSLLAKLESARSRKRLQDKTFGYLTGIIQETKAQYPGTFEDKLYKSTYRHMHHDVSACTICAKCEKEDAAACDDALRASCSQLKCDEAMLVRRGRLDRAMEGDPLGKEAEQKPFIHYGLIASGDTVMKSGKQRDKVAAEAKVIAFEMEAAGVWDNLPSVVIKGVCDYGDSHKNEAWQSYAAATAAACAKGFLSEWTPTSQTQSSLKGHWLLPFGRNEHFVGRVSHIQAVMTKLHPENYEDNCQRAAIAGLGGVGKTQIALEAAYRLRKTHPDQSVFWVPAMDMMSFERAYREIGKLLGIPSINEDKADVKSLVKVALSRESTGSWLLVVDNADDINLLYNRGNRDDESSMLLALADYLPFSPKGSILLTTRDYKVAVKFAGVNAIKVEEMTGSDSLQLLKKSLGDASLWGGADIMSRLLDLLTQLPLAIKQAAAFMNENGTHVSKYVEIYESKELPELLSMDFEDQGRYREGKNPIAMTWLVSFNQILKRNALATEYLYFMSCVAQQDVPETLLPSGSSPMRKTEALGTLKAYAFITLREGQDSYYIHRLVRLVVQNWLKEQGQLHVWARKTLRNIAEVFPYPKHENRDVWTLYLPHAQCILNDHDSSDYSGDDEVNKRRLLSKAGCCFQIVGKYAEAEQMLQQALNLMTNGHDPDTVGTMSNLAVVLGSEGKYAEAESMLQETLKLQEEVLGKKHPDTLNSMNNLAVMLESQGRYAEAEKLYQEAVKLQLQEKMLDTKHSNYLTPMSNLAGVQYSQGRYAEAEQLCQETLKLQKKVLSKEHPHTLNSMNNLAAVLYKQSRYAEAEKMYQEIIQLQEKVLSKKHPHTLISRDGLAEVLYKQGRYAEAEKMYQETFQLRETVLSKKHPNTLSSRDRFAQVLSKQGRYAEAEKMHQETLQLQENVLGKEHPNTLGNMNNLAVVLSTQGRHAEAEKMHQETLQLLKKVLSKEHPDTLASMDNCAQILAKQGRYAEAEKMHQETLQLQEKLLSKKHPDTLTSMNNLAVVLYKQGRYAEAEKMYQETLQLQEKVLGREHSDTLQAMYNLGIVLGRLCKDAAAESMHQETLQLREKVLGKEHPDALDSMHDLAMALFNQGKYEEAGRMLQQTLQLREKVLGKEHPETLNSREALAFVRQRIAKVTSETAMCVDS